jgi:hypothetical protein
MTNILKSLGYLNPESEIFPSPSYDPKTIRVVSIFKAFGEYPLQPRVLDPGHKEYSPEALDFFTHGCRNIPITKLC